MTPQFYDVSKLPFMKNRGDSWPVSMSQEMIPPQLLMRDDEGADWTLGYDYSEVEWRTGKYEYDVVRNGRKTGEFARNIVFRVNSYGKKVVRIWGADGWREWRNGRFV